jgi:tetratricopeptide (TPR) repeat protein
VDSAWASLSDSVLEAARRVDDPEIIAYLLNSFGRVERRQGRLERAKSFWMKSLIHMERANRLDGIANALVDLAQLELEMGQTKTAMERLLAALETYRRLDMQAKVEEVEALLAKLEGRQTDEE